MIHRIFDYAEVPSHCVFEGLADQPVMAHVVKLSRSKAILDVSQGDIPFESGTTLEAKLVLEVEGNPFRELTAEIQHAEEGFLFLRWEHPDEEKEGKLQDFLAAHARDLDEIEVARAKMLQTRKVKKKRRAAPKKKGAPELRELDDDLSHLPQDGVGATILRRSRRVSAADLAEQVDSVRVLNMSTITALIQEAVDEVLEKTEHQWSEEQRQSLLEEAEEAFNERLEAMQAEKAGLEATTNTLRKQLETAQGVLADEQQRVVSASQFTVSDAGMQEMERRLERLLEHSVRKGKVSPETEEEMRAVVSKLLDDEREKIRDQAAEAQSDALELLERKVDRLAKSLEDTQKARDRAERRAKALESAGVGPIQNIFDTGLDDEDPDKEKKLALLREIIEINRDVRGHMAEMGIEIKHRQKPADEEPSTEDPVTVGDDDVPIILADDTDLFDGAAAAPLSGTTEMEELNLEQAPWKKGTTLDEILEQGDEEFMNGAASPQDESESSPASEVKKISVPKVTPPPPLERTT